MIKIDLLHVKLLKKLLALGRAETAPQRQVKKYHAAEID